MKYLISGGGTGGHIFPAVSIANALREADPNCEILFVGALGRMEMERVPQAGYKIIGLPVKGFDRSRPWRNIRVVIDLIRSMRQARKIVRDFRPDVGVGVGGYASGAAMKVAAKMGVPILLQEQNGFAGVTNKLLKDDAKKICVAYEGMERFFPKEKIILTGNPVRQNLTSGTKEEAIKYFNQEFGVNFSADKKTLLIIGGSLGARTINQSIIAHLNDLIDSDIQVIWQTGKNYFADCQIALEEYNSKFKIHLHRLRQPNATSVCLGRLGHLACGCLVYLRVVFAWQTIHLGAIAQRGRRPPNPQRNGVSQERCGSFGKRCGCKRHTHCYSLTID